MNNPGPFTDVAKKYDEKIKSIMGLLLKINSDNIETVKEAEGKVEQELTSFEKLMDEEAMNRIMAVYKINIALIGKLKEMRYDFNTERTSQSYENMINNLARNLENL